MLEINIILMLRTFISENFQLEYKIDRLSIAFKEKLKSYTALVECRNNLACQLEAKWGLGQTTLQQKKS